MAMIALLIRLDSPGPALFRQKRVGENGRPFDMFKFRTMIAGAEGLQEQVLTTNDDGQVIHKRTRSTGSPGSGAGCGASASTSCRSYSMCCSGEMSLVGPRPELPWLVDRYEPWQRKRFAVPQGITGWWQINGRSDKPMHLNTEDDLYYVYNYSLWLDMRILLMTPLAALRGRGAFLISTGRAAWAAGPARA